MIETKEFRSTIMESLGELTDKNTYFPCLTNEKIELMFKGNYQRKQEDILHLDDCTKCCDAVGFYARSRRSEN